MSCLTGAISEAVGAGPEVLIFDAPLDSIRATRLNVDLTWLIEAVRTAAPTDKTGEDRS